MADHSALIKRKPIHALLHPKPPKINKTSPNHNLQHLSFDPFNPHPGMSKEERKLARMIRNRTAAQASRDRKKEHVAELENRVRELEEQVKLLSRPQTNNSIPPSCLRPCCRHQQHAACESSDASSTDIPPAHTDTIPWACRPISESIDPSINDLKPSSSSSPEPSRSKSTPIIPQRDHLIMTLDPQLEKIESPHHGQQSDSVFLRPTGATISPTQAEYLSRVRIHVLEEENMQLKSQLEYELKKAHQFKSRLISSRLAQPGNLPHHQPKGITEELPIDQGLIEMMLKDEEIENLLLTSSAPAPHTAFQQQTQVSTPKTDSYTHPEYLSLDWDSFLLDRETSTSFTTPRPSLSSMDYEQPLGGTRTTVSKAQSVSDDWPIIDGLGSPDSSSIHGLETQPETPPPDQQPQAPSDAQLALPGPSAQSISHHRLVAREVNNLSLQRNGWEMGLSGPVQSSEAEDSSTNKLEDWNLFGFPFIQEPLTAPPPPSSSSCDSSDSTRSSSQLSHLVQNPLNPVDMMAFNDHPLSLFETEFEGHNCNHLYLS
ncbi:hypothetical protein VP01_346g11 [Puccinia sorghi]|uniref:BZIP domain-containing protein n=1 Tax=Puccinia sorghi TaxID=27349 RepID=A0A0L6UWV6_9BASI|nr:hypothetical protein VP01_346g11 [Puccinia sorghi]